MGGAFRISPFVSTGEQAMPDIIIIGAGIAGISAAAQLAGDHDVLLLEQEPVTGYHASGRSIAVFNRNYGNPVLRALNAVSAPVLEAPEGISDHSLLTLRGELLVAHDGVLADLNAHLEVAQGIEVLDAQQACDLVPILRPERIVKASIEWDTHEIDVDRMQAGYLRLFKARGGRVDTRAQVTGLSRANGVWTVDTPRGQHMAPVVVNAAGAWASGIGALAGALPIEITPLRRSVAVVPGPDGHDMRRWPLFACAAETWYAKPTPGPLLISPAEEDPVPAGDAWADDMVLAEGLFRYEQNVDHAIRRIESNWAGLRSFAPDRAPVVGFDPQAEGFFWLAGQGGYGFQTAPALSQLAADLLSDRTPVLPGDIIAALAPGRFVG
ncbi:MAG: FAD-binding oxidoreductase [Pelagimonas sp.]|jgi:D-arginine dehydrogenase|nr:FAD-binding oxidoreductase [Pelagimonas sp.]